MGHDIFGFATGPAVDDFDDDRKELAYLRRSAGNPLARNIYIALNATDADCGCSGCGDERHFTAEELAAALARLPADDDDYAPERKFLQDCIANGAGGAWITFC